MGSDRIESDSFSSKSVVNSSARFGYINNNKVEVIGISITAVLVTALVVTSVVACFFSLGIPGLIAIAALGGAATISTSATGIFYCIHYRPIRRDNPKIHYIAPRIIASNDAADKVSTSPIKALIDAADKASKKETVSFNAFRTTYEVLLKIIKDAGSLKNHQTEINDLLDIKDADLIFVEEAQKTEEAQKAEKAQMYQAFFDTKTKLTEYRVAAGEARDARDALGDDFDVDRCCETSKNAADRVQYLTDAALNDAVKDDKELIQSLTKAAIHAYKDTVLTYKKVSTVHTFTKNAVFTQIIGHYQSPEEPSSDLTSSLAKTSIPLSKTLYNKKRAERALQQIDPTLEFPADKS